MILNARVDQRARRIDVVADILNSDADRRPRALVARVAPLVLGTALGLVGATGPALLLPRVLAVLSADYLPDLDAAAAAVRGVLPRFAGEERQRPGAAGRPAVMLFGLGAEMEVAGYRVTLTNGRSEVQRLKHGAVVEPDLAGLALRCAGVPDLADAAAEQLEWLRDRGVVGGGRLIHYALTDRLLVRVLDREVPGGAEALAQLEAAAA